MIKSVKVEKGKRYVTLTLQDGNQYSYPWIWLKDNCRCNSCIFEVTEARKTQIKDLDLSCEVVDAQSTEKGRVLSITWSDKYVSEYPIQWLRENRFTNDGVEERRNLTRLTPRTWSVDHEKRIFKADFHKFMTDDETTYNALVAQEYHGLFILQNCPLEGNTLEKFSERINAWLRPQHHGNNMRDRTVFNIRTDMIQTSDVYTSGRLNHHTDLTYCLYPPCIQMLFCMAQTESEGGDSIFSDGFKVANEMREKHPELFKILTETPVAANDFGGYYYDFYMVEYGPTIELDVTGELKQIRFANHARYSPLNMPIEKVELFYKAYQMFEGLLEKHHIEHRLVEGEMVAFDNQRVTHGRLPFSMRGGRRHLMGSYVEFDDMRSARRVLQRKLNKCP